MTVSDFGLSVFASWLANNIGELIGNKKIDTTEPSPVVEHSPEGDQKERLFETFDVFLDLERILPNVLNPVAHILVENTPSSFYNLACLVVESGSTGEWYVFRRGRMAFQGSGGGIAQSKKAITLLREAGGAIAVWSVDQQIIEKLERGIILWPSVRYSFIPLVSSICKDHDWKEITNRASSILKIIE